MGAVVAPRVRPGAPGRDIAAERARQQITQAELAQELGVKTQTMADIELGRVPMGAAGYAAVLVAAVAAVERIAARRETDRPAMAVRGAGL